MEVPEASSRRTLRRLAWWGYQEEHALRIAMLGVKSVPCAGGIPAYTEQLGKRLVRRGHDVTVYCRRQYADTDQRPLPPYHGMERKLSGGIRGKYFDAITHTLSAAVDTLRQRYDVVHIHGSAPAIVAPLLRMRRRTPVVVTIHGMDWQGRKWGTLATTLMRTAAGIPVRCANDITVVSSALEDYYRDAFGRETIHIPTGVDLPQLRPAAEITRQWGLTPGSYLLFVGRLTPEKNLDLLLPVFSDVNTDRKLVIVGDANFADPYVDRLKEYASDRVLFTGYQRGDVLAELFSNAHVYVQPSSLEGLSVAVLEALSYGRCVLASDIPGNVEALSGCGRTFRAGDAEDLRNRLDEMLADDAFVASQHDVARRHVETHHNWEINTGMFEEVYENLLRPRRNTLPDSRPSVD